MEAVFEVKHKDLLGRLGLLTIGSKKVETPVFVPVINPLNQVIPAEIMAKEFGCKIVITNSYILLKRLREKAEEEGVHSVIGFNGVVMTDSGGYQILQYGDVDATPIDIAKFQEKIGSDIAVPLDTPTGLVDRKTAESTVENTLANVRITIDYVGRDSRCVWAAPIQGGLYPDLVEKCIKEYEEMGFNFYCLGSPTPLMTSYRYDKLVTMIVNTKRRLDVAKPLHLFGAGHPMLFPLITALGCDLFDSASYALFASEERYMLPDSTVRLEQLSELPCICKVCLSTTVKELMQMSKKERFEKLALHNLSICFMEMKKVKQAIWEGRLFELVEKRAKAHPALYEAFVKVLEDEDLIKEMEFHTPISKKRGLFLFDELSLKRPEISRAVRALDSLDLNPRKAETAVLINHRTVTVKNQVNILEKIVNTIEERDFEVFTYGTPFGLVPLSLTNYYPYSQTNYPTSLLKNLEKKITEKIVNQLKNKFKKIYVIEPRTDVYPGYTKHLTRTIQQNLETPVLLMPEAVRAQARRKSSSASPSL